MTPMSLFLNLASSRTWFGVCAGEVGYRYKEHKVLCLHPGAHKSIFTNIYSQVQHLKELGRVSILKLNPPPFPLS